MLEILRKLEKGDKHTVLDRIKSRVLEGKKTVIVTLNSEHINEPSLTNLLMDSETLLVSDGIAVQQLTRFKAIPDVHKLTGVEVTQVLLAFANEHKLSVGVYGANEESNTLFNAYVQKNFPNIPNFISYNGYYADKEAVFESFKNANMDIILVAMGVPRQERLIESMLPMFDKGVFVGIGGTLDVLGGYKKRAPEFFQKSNTEWLYRIAKEPQRISRFLKSNAKLLIQAVKEKS